jgi:hypothetical protein
MVGTPGFSADGLSIENPTLFLQSILPPLKASEPPTLQKASNTASMLIDPINQNIKFFESTSIPGLSRISSSAYNNCCWFDTFLYCMIPDYRATSITDRIPIFKAFREWCTNHAEKILAEAPSFMNKPGLSDAITQFKTNVGNLKSEIDWLSGFLIAWYFGVNLIYVNQPYKGIYALVCETAYQSPDCKVILMNLSQSTASTARHYEPIGNLNFNTEFIFDWKEENTPGSNALCYLKQFKELVCDKSGFKIHASWKYPKKCPKEILEYSTNIIEKYKQELIGKTSIANISKANYGEKVADLLAKIESGDKTALNELIKMGKKELVDKQSETALSYLKTYIPQIEEIAKTNTNAKNIIEYLKPLTGGKRKTRVASKRRRKTRKSKIRII